MSAQIQESDNINVKLLKAAKNGDTKLVKDLLQQGADINYADPRKEGLGFISSTNSERLTAGITPVLAAASNGHLELVKYLLTEATPRANEQITDAFGANLLHYAAVGTNFDLLKWLLENTKIDVHAVDQIGENTPLMSWISYRDNLEIFKLLLDKTTPATVGYINYFGDTIGTLGVKRVTNPFEVLTLMLTKIPEIINTTNRKGQHLGHFIISRVCNKPGAEFEVSDDKFPQYIEILKFLVEKFPEEINKTNKKGENLTQALFRFSGPRQIKAMGAIYSAGAYAVQGSIKEDLEKLFNIGARSDLAAEEIKLIRDLEAGVNGRLKERGGNNPLHHAVINGNKVLALRLLEAGARLDLKTDSPDEGVTPGKMPLKLAQEKNDKAMIALLSFYQAKQLIEQLEKINLAKLKDKGNPKDEKAKAEVKGVQERKESKEKEEKQKIEDDNTILERLKILGPEAIKILADLQSYPKELQELIRVDLANILLPTDAFGNIIKVGYPTEFYIDAYNILSQIPKENPFFKEANKRMHELLTAGFMLIPRESGPPLPRTRDEIEKELRIIKQKQKKEAPGKKETQILPKKEALGLDEAEEGETEEEVQDDDERFKEEIRKIEHFTLENKLRHLLIADPNAEELTFYMAKYVYPEEEKGRFDYFKSLGEKLQENIKRAKIQNNPEAIMVFLNSELDKIRIQNLERAQKVYKTQLRHMHQENERLKTENAKLRAQLVEQIPISPAASAASPAASSSSTPVIPQFKGKSSPRSSPKQSPPPDESSPPKI